MVRTILNADTKIIETWYWRRIENHRERISIEHVYKRKEIDMENNQGEDRNG